MRSRAALPVWLMALGIALFLLNRLGDGTLAAPPVTEPAAVGRWVEERGAAVAAFAVIRLLAVGAAWYLLAVTLLGVAVRLVGAAAAVSVTDAFTVPLVRHLLHSTLAAGLTVGSVSAPFVAGMRPAVLAASRIPATAVTTTTTEATTTTETPPPTATMRLVQPAEPTAPAAAPAAPAGPGTYEVRPGDHLWGIAERVMAERLGREATDAEVAPYWRRLIDLNEPADPDLIFPGDVVRLPPP